MIRMIKQNLMDRNYNLKLIKSLFENNKYLEAIDNCKRLVDECNLPILYSYLGKSLIAIGRISEGLENLDIAISSLDNDIEFLGDYK